MSVPEFAVLVALLPHNPALVYVALPLPAAKNVLILTVFPEMVAVEGAAL